MSNVQESLNRFFKKHRIVFWYDTDKELRKDFESVELENVEKIELRDNEFSVKHRILREEADSNFLLYYEGPRPDDLDNWLLDVLLAHGEFRTDQASIYLAELGLGYEFVEITEQHLDFFKSSQRRAELRKLLAARDSHQKIRLKMLAVCAGTDAQLDIILEALLGEFSQERDEKFKRMQRSGLESFLWEQIERNYGYVSDTKSILDFAISLFKSCYASDVEGKATLGSESIIFLKRWKDSVKQKDAFETISQKCEKVLDVSKDLPAIDYKNLQYSDYFKCIDQKIITDLIAAVAGSTISTGECVSFIRTRRQSHWYLDFEHIYEAIEHASKFLQELDHIAIQLETFSNGVQTYSTTWFKIDQLYRKFIYHRNRSGMTSLLQSLTTRVENLYTNNFLLPVNDVWQEQVDNRGNWGSSAVVGQQQFHSKWVEPFSSQGKKVYVIITDAFRFEIGEELQRLIQREDRYEADLGVTLGVLPSYTQLGMAALLPHKSLGLLDDGNSISVRADDQATNGTANRSKILENAGTGGGRALRAEEFLGLNRDDCRAMMKESSVVYIYHNRIDAAGDKKESEGRVFEAVEETLEELIKIIKKLTGNNATNILVTSDHGFLYQDKPLDESDFSAAEPQGTKILHRDRRFIVGRGLEPHTSLKQFTAEQLGLSGDYDVQISKSINRMRLKGSGSRFVHGGATLQEIVLPVVKINKKRQSDVSKVSVDIISSGSGTITTGQISVAFYQAEPVGGKTLPRILRAGIYSADGELVSDSHELVFDLAADEAREREIRLNFLFNRKADKLKGQTVTLKLDEKLQGTSHYQEYKTVNYTMQRVFGSDFDF